jgi:hypothetical protein
MTDKGQIVRAAAAHMVGILLAAIALTSNAEDARESPHIAVAEEFVTAFYSFDPEPLSAVLASAGDSMQDMLDYQGWALGGNYIVMERMPCTSVAGNIVSCSITVQDDLVMALGIGFDVTDTFTLTFLDGAISAVETSSNDPQLYHDARDWVWVNRREWVEQPCDGSPGAAPDPGQCVTNMLKGYREYARLNGLKPRPPT